MKKMIMLLASFITLNFAAAYAEPSAEAKTIQTEINNKQALLLDVRNAEEYAAGHISNAILAPHDTIGQTISQIAPDKKQRIYLYCRSGRRVAIAIATLSAMGYSNLSALGGMDGLVRQEFTLVKP